MPFLCPALEHIQCFANPVTATVTSLMPTAPVANHSTCLLPACQQPPHSFQTLQPNSMQCSFLDTFSSSQGEAGSCTKEKREQQTSPRRSGHRTMASTLQWLHTVLWPRRWMSCTGSIFNPCESSSSFSHWLVNLGSGMYLD